VSVRFDRDALVTQSKAASRRWQLSGPGGAPAIAAIEANDDTSLPQPVARWSATIKGKQVDLASPGTPVRHLTFSQDVGVAVVSTSGRRLGVLLSGDVMTRRLGVRSSIEVWDLERMARLSSATTGEDVSRSDFSYLSFDLDDRFLVTKNSDGFRVWDAATLAPVYSIFHGNPEAIAFQPNGPVAATVSSDGTVRVWRLEDQLMEVGRFRSRSRLTQAVVDAGGRWVAGVSEDGRAPLWAVRPDDLAAQACARIVPRC